MVDLGAHGTYTHTLTLYGFGVVDTSNSLIDPRIVSKCLEMGWSCADKRILVS